MANAKKTTASASKAKTTTTKAKKPVAKAKTTSAASKATTARKTTAAKTPVKRTATKPAAKKATAKSDFMTMQPTRETAYWLIFSLLILALGIWVLTLTIRINDIYDQIERNNSAVSSLDAKAAAKQAAKAKLEAAPVE